MFFKASKTFCDRGLDSPPRPATTLGRCNLASSPLTPPTPRSQQEVQESTHTQLYHQRGDGNIGSIRFEKSARSSLRSLADVWLSSLASADGSAGQPQPAAELVDTAGRACDAVEDESSNFTCFTEILRSNEKTFLCAVANCGQVPIIFVALSETILTWDAYIACVPGAGKRVEQDKQGHSNAAVRDVVAHKVPVLQLGELVASHSYKLVVCGRGIAAAVAQQTAYQLQQTLRLSTSHQDPSSRVMCITFGAPPSSRVSASLFPTLSPLFWNFLIVDSGDMATRTSTASSSSNSEVYIAATEAAHGNCNAAAIDIWPAVMTTVPPPAEMSGPHEWQMAVKDVMASFREYQQSPEAEIQNAANKLQHELQRFTLSTGHDMQQPSFMGPTWFLPRQGMPILAEAQELQNSLDICRISATSLSRCPGDTYATAVNFVAPTVSSPAETNLLLPLKLGADITGFFKPTSEYVKDSEAQRGKVPCMKGCHITLLGPGVQWASKAPIIDMKGCGFDEMQITAVIPRRTSRVIYQSDMRVTQGCSNAPTTESERQASHATRDRLTVTGRVDKKSRKLLPPCPCDAGVVVELRLSTHFSTNRKVKLKMQPAEQDVESLKGKMASIDITSELQRAVLMAACCLNSGDTATRQRGLNVLALIDSVEQWCRAQPEDIDRKLADAIAKVGPDVQWGKSTRELMLECGQGAGVFRQLRDRMGHVMTNNSAIATILAGPLVLQQKSNLYHNVLYSLLIVGLLASIPVVGGVGVAVPLVTLITEGMSAASLVTVACECTVGLCSAAALMPLMRKAMHWNDVAYLEKLEQLVNMLAPEEENVQEDVSILEAIVVNKCQKAVAAYPPNPLGVLIGGPSASRNVPAALPSWSREQLGHSESVKTLVLPDKTTVTTSSLQVLSVHLNRICAMAALRKSSQSCCLVGCLGEVNAGKTTLMRGLMGLAPEPEGFERRNATRHIAAQRMHLHTSTGLRPDPAAPVLVDTPGFFDTDETLRDVALQQSGTMALYIVVVHGHKITRLDEHIQKKIVSLVFDGKPTLVCVNQMTRYLDLCKTSEKVNIHCKAIKDDIIRDADGASGTVDVWATEFMHYNDDPAESDTAAKCRERNIKGLEHVRDWICDQARESGFDVPHNLLDMPEMQSILQ